MYLDRTALLSALMDLAEKDFTDKTLPGVTFRIRELNAQQVTDAREAARPNGTFNEAMFNAILVAGGLIDPETKQPLLTPKDVPALGQGRHGLINRLSNAIWALSEATPEAMKSGGAPDDGGGDTDTGDRAEAVGP